MALLDIYKKEYIGKKKHAWTFLDVQLQKQKRTSKYIVICQCNCGNIYNYSITFCSSLHFPYNCINCNQKKEFKTAYEDDINVYQNELESFDKEDEKKIIHNINDFYIRYYRD